MAGDSVKLAMLAFQFKQLVSGRFKTKLLKRLGHEALTQVSLGFRESRDPYGKPWAPLQLRRGKPLLDTRVFRNSFSVQHTKNGFVVGTAETKKAFTHQYGATITPKKAKALCFRGVSYKRKKRIYGHPIFAKRVVIPARPFLPGKRLGQIWSEAFFVVIRATWWKFIKSGG